MTGVNVNLSVTDEPRTNIKAIEMTDGRRFLVADLAPAVDVILPGLDAAAADYAEKLAEALLEAASELRAKRDYFVGVSA